MRRVPAMAVGIASFVWIMTKDICDRLAAQPFQPFVVQTADGREYDVPTHDDAHVSPGGGRVSI